MITPERKLKFLSVYMDEFIQKWPNKIKPFDAWLESTLAKRINRGKHNKLDQNRKVCAYCRSRFIENVISKTKDHVIPISRGGLDRKENRVSCCEHCNFWKADKLPEDWLREIKYVLKKEKWKPPYNKNILGLMIMNIKKITDEVRVNIKKASTYKY